MLRHGPFLPPPRADPVPRRPTLAAGRPAEGIEALHQTVLVAGIAHHAVLAGKATRPAGTVTAGAYGMELWFSVREFPAVFSPPDVTGAGLVEVVRALADA